MNLAEVPIDFLAAVRFLTQDEGGRVSPPMPGYRCDFRYVDQSEPNHWMVWPMRFFVDGVEVPESTTAPHDVTAGFFIFDRELRESVHRARLIPGVEFELLEGATLVGRGVVTDIAGMAD
jgi:hypothetical protein